MTETRTESLTGDELHPFIRNMEHAHWAVRQILPVYWHSEEGVGGRLGVTKLADKFLVVFERNTE